MSHSAECDKGFSPLTSPTFLSEKSRQKNSILCTTLFRVKRQFWLYQNTLRVFILAFIKYIKNKIPYVLENQNTGNLCLTILQVETSSLAGLPERDNSVYTKFLFLYGVLLGVLDDLLCHIGRRFLIARKLIVKHTASLG